MNEYQENIYRLSLNFREAILRSNKGMLPITLHDFPEGSCGDTSLLLGEYLYRVGCGCFEYVTGFRNEQSHAWIEANGLIVDITSDQFPERDEKVLVTTDKSWHNQFVEDDRNPARIEIYDTYTQRMLNRALEEIIKQL